MQYLFKRKDEHSLHSPFLFDFYTNTSKTKHQLYSSEIESLRETLLSNTNSVTNLDFGAGSKTGTTIRTVGNLASQSLSTQKQSAYFASVASFLKPGIVLELGTSLGINAMYLAKAIPTSKVITVEGNAEVASIARSNFQKFGMTNLQLVEGTFEDKLPDILKHVDTLDFVFFDGNHRFTPTLEYFGQCVSKANENSVFIFHDIYWSPEMEKAWKAIIAKKEVRLSIDMFYFGIVFFKNNQPKQHFILKF